MLLVRSSLVRSEFVQCNDILSTLFLPTSCQGLSCSVVFLLIEKIEFSLLNNSLCWSSWESLDLLLLLFISNKRLFSSSAVLVLLLCSYATSHSLPVNSDRSCYYPPTVLLSCRSNDDYQRLIVYRCE